EDLAIVSHDRDIEFLRERDWDELLQLARRKTRGVGQVRCRWERGARRSHRPVRTIRERMLPNSDAATRDLRSVHRAVGGLDERVRVAGRTRERRDTYRKTERDAGVAQLTGQCHGLRLFED